MVTSIIGFSYDAVILAAMKLVEEPTLCRNMEALLFFEERVDSNDDVLDEFLGMFRNTDVVQGTVTAVTITNCETSHGTHL